MSRRLARRRARRGSAGFAEGDWWVQDAAATLPVRLLGDVAGKTVIDLCAAPGGKTMQLAARGAHVIAVEREAARLARLKENLERTRLTAKLVRAMRVTSPRHRAVRAARCTVHGDGHDPAPSRSALDQERRRRDAYRAPAAYETSGSGGRHGRSRTACLSLPSARWSARKASSRSQNFLRQRTGICPRAGHADEVFGHERMDHAEGDLRTLPCHLSDKGGMDGFYAARLRRL